MNRLFLLLFGAVSLVAHAQVPDYVPTEGLVAWYPFNGNANDESGNGYDGNTQNIGPALNRYGNENAAIAFDGESSYVFIESDFDLNERSACLWVRASSFEYSLVYDTDHPNLEFGLTQFGCGSFGHAFGIGVGHPGGENTYFNSTAAIDTWYMLAFTRENDSTKYYFNGNLEHAVANGNIASAGGAIGTWIGVRRGAGDRFFQGSIDDIGIWNRALTEEEILALYNAEPAAPGCTDPTACNFNEEANENDGSCVYPPSESVDCEFGGNYCGEGTVWDSGLQTCVAFDDCPADLNGNGLVEVSDLLMVLADFGEICEQSTDDELSCEPVSYQGYEYATVAIAGNCWFAENLRADSYRNGDVIETLTGSTSQDCDLYYGGIGLAGVYGETWGCSSDCTDSFDACSDNTNSLNAFGRYYNGHAIVDPRGLCPSGWHPSTDEEWIELEVFAGITQAEAETFGNRGSIAPLLKNSELWCDDNSGTDELGFMAVPAGSIFDDCGASVGAMGEGRWWSLSEAGDGISRTLNAGDSGIWRGGVYGFEDMFSGVQNMLSVRCVKD